MLVVGSREWLGSDWAAVRMHRVAAAVLVAATMYCGCGEGARCLVPVRAECNACIMRQDYRPGKHMGRRTACWRCCSPLPGPALLSDPGL